VQALDNNNNNNNTCQPTLKVSKVV